MYRARGPYEIGHHLVEYDRSEHPNGAKHNGGCIAMNRMTQGRRVRCAEVEHDVIWIHHFQMNILEPVST